MSSSVAYKACLKCVAAALAFEMVDLFIVPFDASCAMWMSNLFMIVRVFAIPASLIVLPCNEV